METKRLFLALLLGVGGCTSAPRISDHGVAQHQAAARHHEAVAQALSVMPTPDAVKQVKLHWKMATEHLSASRALETAEVSACAGLTESERGMSPFAHRADIEGVEPLYEGFSLRQGGAKEVGAAVLLRPAPGLSAQSLQRIVDCHIAHHAVLGPELPEASRCPLMLPGVVATVTNPAGMLAIAMRSDNQSTAHELGRRAAELMYASPPLAQATTTTAAAR